VLNGLSFSGDTVGKGILGLFLVFVGYNVLAYIGLRYTRKAYLPLGYTSDAHRKLEAKTV
jgi:hypothetical protein